MCVIVTQGTKKYARLYKYHKRKEQYIHYTYY